MSTERLIRCDACQELIPGAQHQLMPEWLMACVLDIRILDLCNTCRNDLTKICAGYNEERAKAVAQYIAQRHK